MPEHFKCTPKIYPSLYISQLPRNQTNTKRSRKIFPQLVMKSDLREKKFANHAVIFFDCGRSIRKQICQVVEKSSTWFCVCGKLRNLETPRIFGARSKCLCKDLPPLSMLYANQNIFLKSAKRPRYEFSATVLHKTCR